MSDTENTTAAAESPEPYAGDRGWKGLERDGVGVHPEHALVLVNYGGGDGPAILALAQKIIHSVAERFGVTLEIEPRVYGG